MFKKNIAKLLVFAMILSMLPFAAVAVDDTATTPTDGTKAAAPNVGDYITVDNVMVGTKAAEKSQTDNTFTANSVTLSGTAVNVTFNASIATAAASQTKAAGLKIKCGETELQLKTDQNTSGYTVSGDTYAVSYDVNISNKAGETGTDAKELAQFTLTPVGANGSDLTPSIITIKYTEAASETDETYTATFVVKDGEGQTVSGTTIVVKNGTETVTATSAGTYTLTKGTSYSYTVTAEGYEEATGTVPPPTGTETSVQVSVTLTKATTPAKPTITLNKTALSLEVDGTETLKATVTNADGKTVTWTSSDSAIASVEGGVVTAVAAGTATISANVEGAEKAATCTVKVVAKGTYSISLDTEKTLTIDSEDEAAATATLTASVTPKNADVKWESSDETVVSVTPSGDHNQSATIKALKSSDTPVTIKATALDAEGNTAKDADGNECIDECTVTIKTVTHEPTTYTITPVANPKEGGTVKVTVDGKEVTEAVKDAEVTIVATAATGYTAGTPVVKQGETDVTVTGGKFKMPDGPVTVTVPFTKSETPPETIKVEKVTVTPASLAMTVGDVEKLSVAVEPENATDKTVKWTSSNTDVATVDENGTVTAIAIGEADITAKAGDKEAICKVKVNPVEVKKPAIEVPEVDQSVLNKVDEDSQQTIKDTQANLENTTADGLETSFEVKGSEEEGLTVAGQTVSKTDIDDAKTELAKKVTITDNTVVRTVVVPTIKITVSNAQAADQKIVSMSFQIKAFAEVKVTTAAKGKEVNDDNSVTAGEPIDLKETQEVITITIPLPTTYVETLKNPIVKHKKDDGRTFWHGVEKVTGGISFKNSKGFSEFTIEDATGEAVLGGQYYETLEKAIAAAKDNDEITVLKSGLKATVSKAVTFKLVYADGVTGAVITAGDGYNLSEKNGVYTVTVKPTDNDKPSTGGGGGGGSSKPAIKPGEQKPTTPTTTPGGGVAGFNDVATSAWYADSVKYVVDKGLFGGVGNGNFAPNANMTRAMMWTVLARYMGVNTNTGSNWYEAARTWAMAQNISDGTMADGNVTREQFVTMLWRLSGEPAVETSASFTDNGSISGYAKTAVDWAVAQGILNGYNDGSFRPQGSATRAEVAKMLTVFCQNAENTETPENDEG